MLGAFKHRSAPDLRDTRLKKDIDHKLEPNTSQRFNGRSNIEVDGSLSFLEFWVSCA